MGTHVWGAGGSRRGRRISMDNPLISPWMKNMTRAQPSQPAIPLPTPGQVTDPAALYQVSNCEYKSALERKPVPLKINK